MWHYVRVRMDRIGMVRHPETHDMVTLDPRQPYRSDDPVVKAYPDMFATDAELAHEHQAAEAPVEQATKSPGEKRKYTRREPRPGQW